MIITLIFLFAALAAAVAFVLGGMLLWQAVLLALGVFVGLHLVLFSVVFIVGLTFDLSKPIEKQHPLMRFVVPQACWIICFYSRVRCRLINAELLPGGGRFLLVCNHRSMFDPIIGIHTLAKHNVSFIAKPSVMRMPLVGRAIHGIGCMGIDRENDRNALKTILQAANHIKNDLCSIGIYPEGTRSKNSELLPFHAGSFKIAQRAGVPVVVSCIRGTENVGRNVFRRITNTEFEFLELIGAETVKEKSTAELAEYSRELIARALD